MRVNKMTYFEITNRARQDLPISKHQNTSYYEDQNQIPRENLKFLFASGQFI